MIEDKNKQILLVPYFNSMVGKVFKVLPLYDEGNLGINTYIESLLFELYGLQKAVVLADIEKDYVSLVSTLESVESELAKIDINKQVLKRELFKCIDIVKNMVDKLEKE